MEEFRESQVKTNCKAKSPVLCFKNSKGLAARNCVRLLVALYVKEIDLGISVTNTTPRRIPFKVDKVLKEKHEANIVFLNKLEKGLSLGDLNKKVDVEVKGPSTYMNKIKKVDAYIDLADITQSTSLEAEIYAYDDGGKIIKEVEVNPSSVKVDLPILKSKTVPIKIKFNENTSKNIVTSDFSIEPSSVTIRGNSDVIDSINSIETRPINFNIIKKGNDQVKLNLPDKVTLVDENINFRLKQKPKEVK